MFFSQRIQVDELESTSDYISNSDRQIYPQRCAGFLVAFNSFSSLSSFHGSTHQHSTNAKWPSSRIAKSRPRGAGSCGLAKCRKICHHEFQVPKMQVYIEPYKVIRGVRFPLHKLYPYSLYRRVPPFEVPELFGEFGKNRFL